MMDPYGEMRGLREGRGRQGEHVEGRGGEDQGAGQMEEEEEEDGRRKERRFTRAAGPQDAGADAIHLRERRLLTAAMLDSFLLQRTIAYVET